MFTKIVLIIALISLLSKSIEAICNSIITKSYSYLFRNELIMLIGAAILIIFIS